MTRLLLGPFNRVEGDLEIALDIDGDAVTSARVMTPLYRGFEQILVGRPSADALAIAPRICGICSVSQSMAAASALRALYGVTPTRNGVLAANLAHAAENLADHLTHFYIFFMPDFARAQYSGQEWHAAAEARFKAMKGDAAPAVLAARKRLLEIMGILAGKWPHSLAFQPGGTTCAVDLGRKTQLISILRDFRRFLETVVFAAPLEAVLALETRQALERFCAGEGAAGDLAAFWRIAHSLDLAQLGRIAHPLMSFGAYREEAGPLFASGLFDPANGEFAPIDATLIREDSSHAFLRDGPEEPARARTEPDVDKPGAYSFARAPRLGSGQRFGAGPAEVGAIARQAVHGRKLIRALIAEHGGSNVFARVIARLVELAAVTTAAESWALALALNEPFCAPSPVEGEGEGVGLVEAARGALGHWISARQGKIRNYQIIAPTTWNFSPRDANGEPGPVEQALVGTALSGEGSRAAAVQHVIRSFDPCMVCTAH